MGQSGDDHGLRAQTEALRAEYAGPRHYQGEPVRTLVVLGDSIAYGWGLAYAQSYPVVLEGLLNAWPCRQGDGPWRVVNAGVPGNTVLCAWARYESDVSFFRPHSLIIGLGLNDGALRRTRYDMQREQLWLAQRHIGWRLSLYLARSLDTCTRIGWIARASGSARRQAQPRVRPRLFGLVLESVIGTAKRDGLQVWLLSLPPLLAVRIPVAQRQAYARYDGLIRQVAARTGVPLIDLHEGGTLACGPGEKGAAESSGCWQQDGIHLAANGQARLARRIALALGPLCATS